MRENGRLLTEERERERERLLAENLGEFAPKDVVAPRSDGVPRTAKYHGFSLATYI